MRRSPRFHWLSAMKSLVLSFSALFLVLSVFGGNALATTPITVTIYQDMESGDPGDVLTASIMNASSHGAQGWIAYSGALWVSTAYHRDLPGPVIAGGVTYNGTGGSRSWMFSNSYCMNCVRLSYGSFSELTEACYYTTGITRTSWTHGYDNIIAWGNSSFQCMQTLLNSNGSKGLILHCHAKQYLNIGTNHDPISDSITYGKTYWVCMNYDGSVGQVTFMAFDPDNSYAQVGATLNVVSTYGDTEHAIDFGRGDNHGNDTYDPSQSYFDQILIDSTNGAFPLLPSGANDTTPPGAPPVVRDGTCADQSIALSTTQLSANWEPAVDHESGIKGYEYAIGASQGGTDVVNWTTLINVRGVTKKGLSLTTGQTYYFSVRGINGVGLTGPAANSDGQTVGTDLTAPSAPPAVRDGGSLNYAPDIDETGSTKALWCNWDPATDNESGISCYQYAFGTSPGATDTAGWRTFPANSLNWVGLGLNGTANVTLTPGTRYYASVRAVNNAGITGPTANSDGQTVVNRNNRTPSKR